MKTPEQIAVDIILACFKKQEPYVILGKANWIVGEIAEAIRLARREGYEMAVEDFKLVSEASGLTKGISDLIVNKLKYTEQTS